MGKRFISQEADIVSLLSAISEIPESSYNLTLLRRFPSTVTSASLGIIDVSGDPSAPYSNCSILLNLDYLCEYYPSIAK